MVNLFNVLVFLWGTYWVIKAGSAIFRGTKYSINFIMIVFYLFFILPIGLDVVFGIPEYTYETNFKLASHDIATSLIYNLFIAMVPVIWAKTAIKRNKNKDKLLKNNELNINIVYLVGLLSPVLLLPFAPIPEIYIQYGRAVRGFPTPESETYHALISAATFISITSYFLLLLVSKKRLSIYTVILGTPFLISSIWMNGKRTTVSLMILLLIYTLWRKRVLRPAKLFTVSLLLVGSMMLFSSLYQQVFRYDMLQIEDWEQVYHNMRVDYGRDDITKMAIYAELYPDKLEILDYPFQSFVYTATMYVPREWWSDKPWPYAVYATSAMLDIPTQYVGWGMTTGILDETIANVGWIGFLLGPLVITWICRVGDSNQTPIIQLLTILVGSLMLVLQISAFSPIFFLWIGLVGWQKCKRRIRWSNLKGVKR